MTPSVSSAVGRAAERRAARVREAVALFNTLPDTAFIKVPAALALMGRGKTTYYEDVRKGLAPPVEKICGRASGVRAGEIRRWLKSPQTYLAKAAA